MSELGNPPLLEVLKHLVEGGRLEVAHEDSPNGPWHASSAEDGLDLWVLNGERWLSQQRYRFAAERQADGTTDAPDLGGLVLRVTGRMDEGEDLILARGEGNWQARIEDAFGQSAVESEWGPLDAAVLELAERLDDEAVDQLDAQTETEK